MYLEKELSNFHGSLTDTSFKLSESGRPDDLPRTGAPEGGSTFLHLSLVQMAFFFSRPVTCEETDRHPRINDGLCASSILSQYGIIRTDIVHDSMAHESDEKD